jgi:hypothetical protein
MEKCEKCLSPKNGFEHRIFHNDIDLGCSFYEKFQPKMYKQLIKIEKIIGKTNENEVVKKIYPSLKKQVLMKL